MPSFPILDVAIGMIFVYLLLSLISSSLNEGLESLIHNRSTDLEAGIRNLLSDQKGSWWKSFAPWINSLEGSPLTREFYRHSLIRNLVRTENRLPTYIPARNFALALMDMLTENGDLLRGATQVSSSPYFTAASLVDTVNGVPIPPRLKESVAALVKAADGDARQARINIEGWFNSSMDRVSGWYKSRTQKILFCIGLFVTIAVNADSISIYTKLQHSKNLQSIVNAAQKQTAQGMPAPQASPQEIERAMHELNNMDIGVGWEADLQSGGSDRLHWLLHLLWTHSMGWFITAAAITLGAPFWFDTLNRFMVVRSTVKPREKSVEESSKDSTSLA